MQNTRLNRLFDAISFQVRQWLGNPWRRISLLLISLLLGNFVGTVISTTAGQRANLDVVVAFFLVVVTEGVNGVVYGENPTMSAPFLRQLINSFKIGLVYNLFVEALKLGS
ncbi:MAG: hypothetical protein RLZZ338_665 [Cyanobacteriota bacterium]|jgi:hypothetical protein